MPSFFTKNTKGRYSLYSRPLLNSFMAITSGQNMKFWGLVFVFFVPLFFCMLIILYARPVVNSQFFMLYLSCLLGRHSINTAFSFAVMVNLSFAQYGRKKYSPFFMVRE